MLKEIGRKSVLWLCLVVGLLAGGSLNLLAKVEQDCFVSYRDGNKQCWIGVGGCDWCEGSSSSYWDGEGTFEWWYLDFEFCEVINQFCS